MTSVALVDLITRNRLGQIRQKPGLTGIIKNRFPRLTRKEYSSLHAKHREKKLPSTFAKGKGPKHQRSSIAMGNAFHTHVLHQLVCDHLTECRCPTRVKTVPKGAVQDMLSGARAAFELLHLAPLCGEILIESLDVNVGTRLDMLAVRKGTNRLVLVSWKTTGACPFTPGVVEGRFSRAILEPGAQAVSNVEAYIAQQHLAQVACELHMLWTTHRVHEVTSAVIIYLYPDGRSRSVWLSQDCCNPAMCQQVFRVVNNVVSSM